MALDPRNLGNFSNYRAVIQMVHGLSLRPISDSAQGGLAFKCIGAIGAVVARFVHTEEVTGSNPVSPTDEWSVPPGIKPGGADFSVSGLIVSPP